MDTTGYETEVASINSKLFEPDQALAAEQEFNDLENRLIASRPGTIPQAEGTDYIQDSVEPIQESDTPPDIDLPPDVELPSGEAEIAEQSEPVQEGEEPQKGQEAKKDTESEEE
jgi:hypothetical protein